MEEKRQKTEGGCNKEYRGLPVTSISFILPVTFWLQFCLSEMGFQILLHGVLLVVGFLFILDFPIKKPGLKTILALIAFVIVTVGVIFAYTKIKLPHPLDETNPIVEEMIGECNEIETP